MQFCVLNNSHNIIKMYIHNKRIATKWSDSCKSSEYIKINRLQCSPM